MEHARAGGLRHRGERDRLTFILGDELPRPRDYRWLFRLLFDAQLVAKSGKLFREKGK